MTATIDQAYGFTIPARHARGRLVRLGDALDAILAPHRLPPPIERLLGEAVVLTALLGATQKDASLLTLQAQSSGGAIDLLVCDYRGGELRGYVRHDADRVAALGDDPTLDALFGRGTLAITFDQPASGERYQGIVPLEGASLADAAEAYFAQSEQIPSLARIAVGTRDDGRRIAGGMLIQHLPEGEEGRDRLHTRLDHPEWDHVAALGGTLSAAELVDPALPFDALAWRLFNEEEVRVFDGASLSRGCRCDPAHVRSVIDRFPADERRAMADDAGLIQVDCEYCARRFTVPLS